MFRSSFSTTGPSTLKLVRVHPTLHCSDASADTALDWYGHFCTADSSRTPSPFICPPRPLWPAARRLQPFRATGYKTGSDMKSALRSEPFMPLECYSTLYGDRSSIQYRCVFTKASGSASSSSTRSPSPITSTIRLAGSVCCLSNQTYSSTSVCLFCTQNTTLPKGVVPVIDLLSVAKVSSEEYAFDGALIFC